MAFFLPSLFTICITRSQTSNTAANPRDHTYKAVPSGRKNTLLFFLFLLIELGFMFVLCDDYTYTARGYRLTLWDVVHIHFVGPVSNVTFGGSFKSWFCG